MEVEKDELVVHLHDGEDDVSLVLDGCESHRCDHYDHEVERLKFISLDAATKVDRRL